jgi:hypothetical protein
MMGRKTHRLPKYRGNKIEKARRNDEMVYKIRDDLCQVMMVRNRILK